jgi:hypothetical protein
MGRLVASLFGVMVAAMSASAADDAGHRWPDLTDFLSRLIAEVGPPVKVYRLEIDRDGEVELWIQARARPDQVDRYTYDEGTLGGPTPVKFREYPSVEALDQHVIELTTIDFTRLPAMLASARARLGLADASVVTIRLERGDSSGALTWSGIPIWTFTLETPRHGGRVEFNLAGGMLDVDKD